MNSFAKHAAWVICALFAMTLVAGTISAASTTEKDGRTVVAKVNGTLIYLDELAPLVDLAKARYRKSGTRSFTPDKEKKIQRQELEQLIDRELLVQAGAKEDDKEFAEKVEFHIKSMSQARFRNASSAQKTQTDPMDAHQLKMLRRDALIDAYLEKRGINTLQVPEKDLKEFYGKNKQGLTDPEKVKASHILVALPKKAKDEEVEEAREKIHRISKELKKGGDFVELAKKYSSCATAAKGGDLGYIKDGYMPGEFNKVAFALKPGETSEPIRTQHGFHIIKVFEKKPARVPEFSEVKDTITKYLINDYKRKKVDEIVAELKRKARIVRYFTD